MRPLIFPLTCSLLFASFAAQADDDAPISLDSVTIIGSRLPQTLPGANIEILDREQIERSGADTAAKLLYRLTETTASQSGQDGTSMSPGGASIQLRGLSEKYALVLLNGHRLANYGFAANGENTFVDLNQIPTKALDSVEILRDGASALYGGDAVAGVINFKTRRDFQGVIGTLQAGQNSQRDGGNASGALTLGLGAPEQDGHNVTLTLQASHREPILKARHPTIATDDYSRLGGSDNRLQNGPPGTWADRNFQGQDDQQRDTNVYAMPGCPQVQASPDPYAGGGSNCIQDQARFSWASDRNDQAALLLTANQRLPAGGEAFGELSYAHQQQRYMMGYPSFNTWGQDWWMDPSWKMYPAAHAAQLQAINPTFQNGDPVMFIRPVYELGPSYQSLSGDNWHLLGGWRGDWRGWQAEGTLGYGLNLLSLKQDKQIDTAAAYANLHDGDNGGPGYDPFAAWNSPALAQPFLTTIERKARSERVDGEGILRRQNLFALPGGTAALALGAQFGKESLRDTPDARVVAEQIFNQYAVAAEASRHTQALFAELALPLAKRLALQLALRADRYSDFGTSISPKLDLRWQANGWLSLNAGASRDFKPPTLPELHSTLQAYAYVSDWKVCQGEQKDPASCNQGYKAYQSGNPDLKAEHADNVHFGMSLAPMRDLTLKLDWYRIRLLDAVTALDAQYVIDHEDTLYAHSGYIVRKPIPDIYHSWYPGLDRGELDYLKLPYANVGTIQSSGFDGSLNYRLPLGRLGELEFENHYSRVLGFTQALAPGALPQDMAGGTSLPRWRNILRIGHHLGDWSGNLIVRSYASTLNAARPGMPTLPGQPARLPAFSMLDCNASWQAGRRWQIGGGISNLGDKTPPYATGVGSNGYQGNWDDSWGRSYWLSARYQMP
ncbi:TonB-dependent receptor plug domain-containing protein [Chromobacterium paludis]|uniref:TonB-dependent receptor plug domain-containing protein n=1 Tax=Chromobacterium paludis TaxID=2605945 RepID=A0A5C1DHV9_9NEIS|nr:TonB-dependent receptor [Chromobacterium paludis]QEL56301.1 TonB-dependent receptor plug domain-containing protein [Chromobacterium paludis]